MNKRKLKKAAILSPSLMQKLNKDQGVTTNTLARICTVLGCHIEDITKFVPEEDKNNVQ